jgi:PhoD-like phosphatase
MAIDLRCGPLVRAASPTSIIVWAELASPCTVKFQAVPADTDAPTSSPTTTSTHSISAGGHHYVVLQLRELQPSTWYNYTLAVLDGEHTVPLPALPLQCFRTLDEGRSASTLRVLYGSCRKLNHPEADILNALGDWLVMRSDEREHVWPHLLLLIGDQIYADEPPPTLREHYHLPAHAQSFEDYAQMYMHAWTYKPGIRQALALVPTFMIFDDHELTNNWNLDPTWRMSMLRRGRGQMLVDGLVAYWLYQGWGNLLAQNDSDHPLMKIMQAAAHSGIDVLQALRDTVKQSIYNEIIIPWHYTLPTHPAIFVTNTRADRTTVLDGDDLDVYAPTAIMDDKQMSDLGTWLQMHHERTVILVSSVPVLLPPVIGMAEYVMGIRPWSNSAPPLRWLGQRLAALQQYMAHSTSFEHWAVFAKTWRRLVDLFGQHNGNVLVLSGDVHFSYAIEAHKASGHSHHTHLYQFVSSPIQNELEPGSRTMIEQQSRIPALPYGGLHTRMLPLEATKHTRDLRRRILYENTLGYLTIQPQDAETSTAQHVYYGLVDGRLMVIGRTKAEP